MESQRKPRHLPGDASNVLRAWFGLPSDPWLDAEHKGVPCTQAVQRLLHGRRAVTLVEWQFVEFGDGVGGVV